jgi:hypothetical protein
MPEREPVEFLATLSGPSAVRFDSDGGGKLVLEFDDQQTPELVRLLRMRGKIIKVACQEHFTGAERSP